MTTSTWIIATFALGFLTLLSWLVIAALWYLMKPEGRWFFRRGLKSDGIDVIRHEPLSNRLQLITVKWTGRWFQHGKELIYFGIETLINPQTEPEKYFNEVVSRMCTWAGSKRPVLFATDSMSHLITPDFSSLIAKARKEAGYSEARNYMTILEKQIELTRLEREKNGEEFVEPEIVSFLETVKPDDLKDYMEDLSARHMYGTYAQGKRVAELERKQGLGMEQLGTIAISLAGIGIVILIGYMIYTGRLQELLETFRT